MAVANHQDQNGAVLLDSMGKAINPEPRGDKFFGDYEMAKNGLFLTSDMRDALIGLTSDDPKSAENLQKALNRHMGVLMSLFHSVYSTTAQYGAAEKPRDTPAFELLRKIWEESLVDRLITAARIRQWRHISRRIVVKGRQKGWYVTHVDHKEPGFRMTESIRRRCREVEAMLMSPNPEAHPTGFRDVLVKAVQGELILDRVALIVRSRSREGKALSWYLLPGDTIYPRFKVLMKGLLDYGLVRPGDDRPDGNSLVARFDTVIGRIYDDYGIDLSGKAYVQMIDGRITGAWTTDECYIDVLNPSDELNRQGYGISPLENSLDATTLLLLGIQYNKNHFLSNYPEAFLILQGEFSPQGLQAFKNQIYAEVGPQGNQRLPVIPTGGANYQAELLRLRDSMTDMQFVQLIRIAIALKCSAYGMHPATINFSPDQGADATAIISETASQDTQIALMQEEGFHSSIDARAEFFDRALIQPLYDDLCIVWSVEDQPNEVQRIDLWTKKLAAGATVDEFRHDMGLEDVESVTDGAMDGKFANSPFWFQQQQMKMMAEQQQAQQQADAERGSGGFTGGADEAEAAKAKPASSSGAKPKPKAKTKPKATVLKRDANKKRK
jgi:hypothetical protein